MNLDDLKKSMSTLDQVLAKTNASIEINVAISETAKNKLLKKYLKNIITNLILAVVFTAAIAGGINQLSFPVELKIFLVILLFIATAWYIFLYVRLRKVDVATLTPANLFSKTANVKMLMISGEIFFGIVLAVFFTLLLPSAWTYNRFGFWAMVVTITGAIIYGVLNYYPQYVKLFRDLNSIK